MDGEPLPFDVLWFEEAPNSGVITFATVGLSEHLLHYWTTGREIRQELLMTCHTTQREANIPGLLELIGKEVSLEKHGLLAGEVIGPRGPLFPGRQMTALYAAGAVYFPETMQSLVSSTGQETVFVWLIPIHSSEAASIAADGWSAFEEKLVAMDPDLQDLDRDPIV